jgi:hypothetical protein
MKLEKPEVLDLGRDELISAMKLTIDYLVNTSNPEGNP